MFNAFDNHLDSRGNSSSGGCLALMPDSERSPLECCVAFKRLRYTRPHGTGKSSCLVPPAAGRGHLISATMIRLTLLTTVVVLLLAYVKPSNGIPWPPGPIMCWTSWYDRDNPDGTGDWEDLKHLRMENPGEICAGPVDIQAVTVVGNVPAEDTGQQFYAYNTQIGFICLNEDQEFGRCRDYKVRFRCPCIFQPR
ncbi:cartilage intermediate layer protein 1-like [Nothobranchius furzeri]|uniref:cartilage intermediate layer protein 1-like n=1 Tax=Nothobranchius furzeri TaxID=105023 RepID=UPI003904C276